MRHCLMLMILLFSSPSLASQALPLPSTPKVPADNPQSPGKIALGLQLYFDPRLSKAGNISCNTCHNLAAGGADGRAVAIKPDGTRSRHKTPTVWNAAYLTSFFWYGDAASLEDQAAGPLGEMALGDIPAIVQRLATIPGYRAAFRTVFGDGDVVNLANITRALASFERTLTTPDSPVDRYLRGDADAIDAATSRGLQKFTALGCSGCHNGPSYAGSGDLPSYQKFPVIAGTPEEAQYHLADDPGRVAATGNAADAHLWRVPSLRNVALTAPYFHNGAVKTLPEAVRVMAKTQLGLDLDDGDVGDLCAFLTGLTGRKPILRLPRLPPTEGSSPLAQEP